MYGKLLSKISTAYYKHEFLNILFDRQHLSSLKLFSTQQFHAIEFLNAIIKGVITIRLKLSNFTKM